MTFPQNGMHRALEGHTFNVTTFSLLMNSRRLNVLFRCLSSSSITRLCAPFISFRRALISARHACMDESHLMSCCQIDLPHPFVKDKHTCFCWYGSRMVASMLLPVRGFFESRCSTCSNFLSTFRYTSSCGGQTSRWWSEQSVRSVAAATLGNIGAHLHIDVLDRIQEGWLALKTLLHLN